MAPPSGNDKECVSSASTVAGVPPHDHERQPVHEKDLERDAQSIASSVRGASDSTTARDPTVVDWDGPDDPANPMNWPLSQKAAAIAIVSAITFVRYVRAAHVSLNAD